MILGTPEFRMGTPEGQPAFLHGSAWDVFVACWKLFGLWSGDGRSRWWVSVWGEGGVVVGGGTMKPAKVFPGFLLLF